VLEREFRTSDERTRNFCVGLEDADRWPPISAAFRQATCGEPGCLWFGWSRSVDDPREYVLVEAFRDGEADGEHVRPGHVAEA